MCVVYTAVINRSAGSDEKQDRDVRGVCGGVHERLRDRNIIGTGLVYYHNTRVLDVTRAGRGVEGNYKERKEWKKK
jgi:hypothetical protein